MNTTWFEQDIEKGQRAILQEQLEDRFGSLSVLAQERLQQLPVVQLPV